MRSGCYVCLVSVYKNERVGGVEGCACVCVDCSGFPTVWRMHRAAPPHSPDPAQLQSAVVAEKYSCHVPQHLSTLPEGLSVSLMLHLVCHKNIYWHKYRNVAQSLQSPEHTSLSRGCDVSVFVSALFVLLRCHGCPRTCNAYLLYVYMYTSICT